MTLATNLTVDRENNSEVTVSAEYGFKQSTLKLSINSDMVLKSTLRNQISPGMEFNLSAEMLQSKNHFKFGYSLIMG